MQKAIRNISGKPLQESEMGNLTFQMQGGINGPKRNFPSVPGKAPERL